MAQIHITLNQEEILQLLSDNRDEAFKELLTASLNSILKAESQEQIGAKPYERNDERTDSRNGFRDRDLNTRIGTITLHVPRHRNQPFHTMIFENYCRSEAALVATMAEMVVNGVSTRKVSTVMETLCGTSFSKSAVSDVCRDLDKEVKSFRNRPLNGNYPFVCVDATYFKVRENHRVISKALMLAIATNENGIPEILGFEVYPKESADTWKDFMKTLRNRGLKGVMMITSDAHEGIIQAVAEVFPEAAWQRCQFHFSRNITEKAPKKYQTGLRADLNLMFNAATIEEARMKRDEIIADYKDVAEKVMECLDQGFESCMTVMELPKCLRKLYRTSNHIERINRELKRMSNVIGVFPNVESLIRMMGSVLIEQNDAEQQKKKRFGSETYKLLFTKNIPEKFKNIAEEQRKMLAA